MGNVAEGKDLRGRERTAEELPTIRDGGDCVLRVALGVMPAPPDAE